jgi:hypothetical protein
LIASLNSEEEGEWIEKNEQSYYIQKWQGQKFLSD